MSKLTSPIELIKQSFQIYFKKENLIFLLKFALASFFLAMLSGIPLGALAMLGVSEETITSLSDFTASSLTVIIFILLAVIVLVTVGVWLEVAGIKAIAQVVKGEIVSIRSIFRSSWGPVLWKLFFAGLASGLIIVLGLVVFVIPGIVLAVWYSFTSFALVTGNLGVIESLKFSKKLVEGYFWPVLGRFVLFFILALAIEIVSRIPYIGNLLFFLALPYFVLFPYLIFEDLKRIKATTMDSAQPAQ